MATTAFARQSASLVSRSNSTLATVLASKLSPSSLLSSLTDTHPTAHITDTHGTVCAVDPFKLLAPQLSRINIDVQALLGSNQPTLDTVAKYYLSPATEAKHLRPLIVLLISQATHGLSPTYNSFSVPAPSLDIDRSLSPDDILSDINPSSPTTTTPNRSSPTVLPAQRRLAEIAEMIHVASLLHDDVIDGAASRRKIPSAPARFGNKLAILAGDFVLARASSALARLGSLEVVELISSVIANLVEGELMQLQKKSQFNDQMEEYIEKTFLKTASLMAKTARSATILGGCGIRQGWPGGERVNEGVYEFGKHLGIAFQIIDDVLDYTAPAAVLGKPSGGADLKLGLATAPALYAADQFPELIELIARQFSSEGDVERAQDLVGRSDGIGLSISLAESHAAQALEAIRTCGIPESESRAGLERLTRMVIERIR
ncbi:hypothetical protein CROQUDRAFT_661230 [Cronartium quercuum f. sp. fusiforme G11]|uniref:(2E,6E)-farnesyl diphosphate synthase n=1 Tax=Cronartium quercuum f. sp. fusiforme G11 TaxID=708437 RepID=A0A9P6T9D2_9BASI|nr:hypothetical protein CROQUDRAFT_661230 [Cronartium quercuum f. sp. fusiforme G11]